MSDSVIHDDTASRKEAGSADPNWWQLAFDQYADSMDDARVLTIISVEGISKLIHVPNVVKVLSNVRDDGTVEREKSGRMSLETATQLAEFAQKEIDTGFPLLNQYLVIHAWSATEVLVKHVAQSVIGSDPKILQSAKFQKLKVSLGEIESVDREERSILIVDLVEREIGAELRRGVERFESLLKWVGLDGVVPEAIAKDIYETQQVRNLMVHRRGIADRKFVANCPWLNAQVGSRFKLDARRADTYWHQCLNYSLAIKGRIRGKYGTTPDHAGAENQEATP